MRVTGMTVNEEGLETVTVVMSIVDANAIAEVFGKFNGYALRKLGDPNVYGPLWDLFCKFYEDGHPTGCLVARSLDKINDAE